MEYTLRELSTFVYLVLYVIIEWTNNCKKTGKLQIKYLITVDLTDAKEDIYNHILLLNEKNFQEYYLKRKNETI